MRRVAVTTSGNDSPGFNACIRAVVRMALHYGWEPWGIRTGFAGLLAGDLMVLNSRSVSHIIGEGGTFLGTSMERGIDRPHGLRDMLRNLNEAGIDALVVIGDLEALRTAKALDEAGFPTVGVPGTIENDICGTDFTIGFDTALNTALDALDRIRDTATAQERAFLIEMVGEHSGHLALMAGIAGGAEQVCIPEVPFTLEHVAEEVADAYVRGKKHCVIVVASGARPPAADIAEYLNANRERTGFEVRLTVLGDIQRGGAPMAYDRFLATRLGAAAIQALHSGVSGLMVGLLDGELVNSPLAEVTECPREIDPAYYELSELLAR
ncbi:MAG: 6-phosphofructokinase [Chloroflexi bacterium]|nr:6-phosphofructokinase [Chloroflexota bacterium]